MIGKIIAGVGGVVIGGYVGLCVGSVCGWKKGCVNNSVTLEEGKFLVEQYLQNCAAEAAKKEVSVEKH